MAVIDAKARDLFAGATIAQLTEAEAVNDKRFKDVALAQSIKLIGVNKINIRTSEMMESESGDKIIIKVNKGRADERVVRIKSKADIAKEDKERENAEKNGQTPKPRSLEGKLIGTTRNGIEAALAANKLQLGRIVTLFDMISATETVLNDRIASLEKQLSEAITEENGEDVIIIAKQANNTAGGDRNQQKQQ
jgi:hypothetical protein